MIPRRSYFLITRFCSLYQSTKNANVLSCQTSSFWQSHKRHSSIDHNENKPPGAPEGEDAKENLIQLEIGILREEGKRVPNPDSITKWQWEELLKLRTKSARMSYYNFLFVTEKKKENEKKKKEIKAQVYQEFKERRDQEVQENPQLRYSVFSNSFLLRIQDGTMNYWRNSRLTRAMQFGDKLIFDCSYGQYMTTREEKATAKQLMFSFAENRKHKDPFDLHFCSADFSGDTMKQLERYIPNVRDKTFPLNLHEASYLNLFPKKQLVYLTPHCKDILTEYDPDSIYIVGAIVDKSDRQPYSLAKAKELNIKMAKLPLDRYLEWGDGSGKSLTLDQMTKILLDFKESKSWDFALRHVPRRKIVTEELNENRRATKWSGNSNKFNRNTKSDSSDSDYHFNSERNDQIKLTTAEKFKRKLPTNNMKFDEFASGRYEKLNIMNEDSKMSTAEKFKKSIGSNNGSKNKITRNVITKDFFSK